MRWNIVMEDSAHSSRMFMDARLYWTREMHINAICETTSSELFSYNYNGYTNYEL